MPKVNAEKYIGQTFIASNGMKMTITAYRGTRDIDVEFEDGTVVEHKYYSCIKNGKIKNPNCKEMRGKDPIDLTGQRFGKLIVLERAEYYISPKGHPQTCWKCKCDCGNITNVRTTHLTLGRTKSCGCLKSECFKNVKYVKKGINDLASQRPDLLEEWDYEKNTIKPDEIGHHSSQRVWWKCKKCSNNWEAVISNRSRNSHNCPNCHRYQKTSFPEQAIYYYVKQIFPDAINSDKHLEMELDIYIPSLDVAIEYDGEVWHTEKKTKLDLRKNQLCIDNNIELIRVREPNCIPIENCTIFKREDNHSDLSLDIVISDVLRYLTSSISIDVDITRDASLILSQYTTRKYKKSLLYHYPDIAKEWHPTKNNNLTPDKISYGSQIKVWWLGKCGHEWQMRVHTRTTNQGGCPYCNHNKVLIGFNDLQSQFPDMAKEWHPTKNGNLKPTDFTSGSHKRIWWLGKCGHEWQVSVYSRTQHHSGCPYCWRKSRPVICVETNTRFESTILASKFTNIKWTKSIYDCCRGKTKTAGGYHWKFAVNQ